MDDYQLIAERFQGTIESIAMSVDTLAAPISQASELMTQTLLRDGKIVTCGNGVDSAQAQLFAASLLCALEQERPALPALHIGSDSASLTAIAAESSSEIYARQLRGLGQDGDDLFLFVGHGADDAGVELDADAGFDTELLQDKLRNFGVVDRSFPILGDSASARGELLEKLGHDAALVS